MANFFFFFPSFSDQLKMSGIRKTKLKPKNYQRTPGSLPLNKLDSQHKQQNNGQEDVTNKRRGKSQAALSLHMQPNRSHWGWDSFPSYLTYLCISIN